MSNVIGSFSVKWPQGFSDYVLRTYSFLDFDVDIISFGAGHALTALWCVLASNYGWWCRMRCTDELAMGFRLAAGPSYRRRRKLFLAFVAAHPAGQVRHQYLHLHIPLDATFGCSTMGFDAAAAYYARDAQCSRV